MPFSNREPESAAHQVPAHASRRFALWLFAAFQFFYMLTSTGRVRTADEYNTFYTTESLVLRGSTAVPQAVRLNNFFGRYDLHGQPRAGYPPGQALLCAPWYAVGHYLLARLPGVPADDTDLVVEFSCCLSSATFSALTLIFFFLLLEGSGIPARASLFAAVMVGLGTPIFAYSGWMYSEPISAAIFMGVAWLLFGQSREPISLQTAAIAGLVLGLATMVRFTDVLAIPVFAVAVWVRDGKPALRAAFVLGVAAAMGVSVLLVHNTLLFGGPFEVGTPATAEGGNQLRTFDTPLATKGLYGLLLSPGKSVFLFAPPALLALAGFRRLWKLERGTATVAMLFPFTNFCFFASYTHWEAGYCVGPRYLVPSIALLSLGLGPMLAGITPFSTAQVNTAKTKAFAILLLIFGALVQCVSLATSFMEDQVPRGRYYDANWNYRPSYSFGGQVQLLWKYLRSGEPARLGLGWDRWFVFLHKGGISGATLAVLGVAMLAGLAISLAELGRSVRSAT